MPTVARPSLAMQSPKPADCRHSKQAFDALFAIIGERRDIGTGAKLLYGKLVTMHRVGAAWTQTELGEMLGTCRQNVWRWTNELVAAGLLLVVRLGQGRPNQYTLLGVPQEDLDGNAPRFRRTGSGHQDGRRPGQDRRDSYKARKNNGKKPVSTPPTAGGGYLETREGTYQLVDGRMRLVPRT